MCVNWALVGLGRKLVFSKLDVCAQKKKRNTLSYHIPDEIDKDYNCRGWGGRRDVEDHLGDPTEGPVEMRNKVRPLEILYVRAAEVHRGGPDQPLGVGGSNKECSFSENILQPVILS